MDKLKIFRYTDNLKYLYSIKSCNKSTLSDYELIKKLWLDTIIVVNNAWHRYQKFKKYGSIFRPLHDLINVNLQ